MALELSTIGITLGYAPEATAGTKPTTGYTNIANIKSIGAINAEPETLEVTDLSDTFKRFIAGVASNDGKVAIGANYTKAFATAWNTLRSAYTTAFAAGKAMWFKIGVTNFGDFYFSGEPIQLGSPDINVNEVFAGEVSIITNQIDGWTMAE